MIAGLTCAVISAICNGSFGSLSKLESCRDVHPYIFNFWVCQGIVVSSMLYLLAEISNATFEPLGLLSGLFFTVATANSFAAIASLGLSIASGVWCGTAVLTSFAYGQAVQHEGLAKFPLAMISLVILVVGISGIASAGLISSPCEAEQPRVASNAESVDHAEPLDEDEAQVLLEQHRENSTSTGQESIAKQILGLVPAVLAGTFGGLVLAPMGFAPEDNQGLVYIPSMGLGVLVASPLVTWVLLRWANASAYPALSLRQAAIPGMIAGTIWNIGNGASIIAVKDPSVGLSVGYPIMQCGLAVAGLWGVLVFQEITGRAQAVYWASAAVVIAGASLLAVSKT